MKPGSCLFFFCQIIIAGAMTVTSSLLYSLPSAPAYVQEVQW